MMNPKTPRSRALAALMSFVMAFTLMPFPAYAAQGGSDLAPAAPIALTAQTADETFAADLADSSRGTQANPYRISTEADLFAFAEAVNGGNSFSGKYVQLEADIAFTWELDGKSAWTPIGTSSTPFAGNFVGNGKTVSNFKYVSDAAGTSSAPAYNGFFGYVGPGKSSDPAASISGLKLVGAHASSGDVDVQGSLKSSYACTGGLVGGVSTKSVSISNCYIDVNVKGFRNVGGFVGSGGSTPNLAISNCVSCGTITGVDASTSVTSETVSAYIGGFVGLATWSSGSASFALTNCLFLGQVVPSQACMTDTTVTISFRRSANALVGRVGNSTSKTFPSSALVNSYYVEQSANAGGADYVQAARAGSSELVLQAKGNVVDAPSTAEQAAGVAKAVNGDQSSQVWRVEGTVPVPAPFGAAVEYPAMTHSITYELNNGSWVGSYTPPSLYAEGGEAVALPPSDRVERSGCSFKGWYDNADFTGSALTEVSPDAYTGDVTLYAKWARVCTVTFDAGAGTFVGSNATQVLEEGDTVTKPSDPTPPAGKTFVGWYNGSAEWNFSTALTAANAGLTLTAKYRGATVDVVFDSNGGTLGAGTVSPVAVEKGTAVAKPTADPKRAGCEFVGWRLQGASANYDFAAPVNAAITLYATWAAAKPVLDTADASYNLTAAQYIRDEPHASALGAPATANGGTLSYEWYRSTSPILVAGEKVGTGATCTPDVGTVGTFYYYCHITNTAAGMTEELTTDPVKVEVVASSTGITGTYDASDNPVRISTKADLEAFRTAVNDGTLAYRDAVLLHDVDLQNTAWTPIGRIGGLTNGKANAQGTTIYYGTFDGRGHAISGLNASSSTGGVGLFGYVEGVVYDGQVVGGRIQNLVVKGKVSSDGPCTGGVVAIAGENASFVNVGNEAAVISTYSHVSYGFTGGIAGKAEAKKVSFAGCYNKGAITGMNHVAGICGYQGTAVNCYNLGTVEAQRTSGYAGGILGDGNDGATGCYGYGKVATASGAYYGAILASGSGMVSCYYHSGNTDKANGGYTSGSATSFADASTLLEALPSETWQDGAEINSAFASMPALYWETTDKAYYDVVAGAATPAGAGTFAVDKTRAAEGDTVTVVASPGEAKVIDAIAVTKAGGGTVEVALTDAGGTFAMPADGVTVAVSFKDAPAVEYAVRVAEAENGSLSVSPAAAVRNATITVTATPDSGYEVASITAAYAGGTADVTLTATGGTFRMPAGEVTVSATFKRYSHHTVRITAYPVSGESLPAGLSIVLVDALTGAKVAPDYAGGGVFRFDAAIEGHSYSVAVETPGYTLAEAVSFTAGQGSDAMTSRSVQLAYEVVERTVTFDPGEGAFPADAGLALVGGKVVKTVANGGTVVAPTVAPTRAGYVFGGWYDGDTPFNAGAPVTADVAYTAKWTDASQVTGTFLTDLAGTERDGSYARPLRITDEQDLYDFARVVNGVEPSNGAWVPYNGGVANPLAGLYVSLENDIALTKPATPVGIGSGATVAADAPIPFSGTFLGNNHTISNFSVSGASNPEWAGTSGYGTKDTKHVAGAYSALFGAVAGATIQDVRVQIAGSAVQGLSAQAAGGLALPGPVAGLVAQVGAGTTRIGHCAVDGAVQALEGELGATIAGGLVGVYAPAGNSSTLSIDHSYQDGAVSSGNVAGGLVGSIGGNGLSIASSYHAGAVSGSAGHVGSFVGDASTSAPKSVVADCVTELAASEVPAAGGSAAAECDTEGTLTGKPVAEWTGDDVKALLGTAFFDFSNLKSDSTMPFGATTWEQGNALTFEAPGAGITGEVPVVSKQSAGAKVVIPTCTLERAGYMLAGWLRTDTDADSRVYAAGSTFTMPDEPVTLTAQWSAIAYGISYELGGKGSWKEGSPAVSSYTVQAAAALPAASELEGAKADGVHYEFAGWYADETLSGSAVAEVPAGQTGAKTFWAKWNAVKDSVTPENPGGETDGGGGSGGGSGNGSGGESTTPTTPTTPAVATQVMYRLYNPNSGEHFYTAKAAERDSVRDAGWDYEGEAWTAPATSATPVYRLYSGTDHHYTTNKEERDWLVNDIGWKDEGVGWYSDDAEGVALYRLYNPNVDPSAPRNNSGSHHYTVSAAERDMLIGVGWVDEKIAWYGVKK